jgi:hypothetical protein
MPVELHGTLIDDGSFGNDPATCGFEWGPTLAYGTFTPTTVHVSGDNFTQIVFPPALHVDTTYHYRSIASNMSYTGYGADQIFVVPATFNIPSLQTVVATYINGTMRFNGIINDDGGAPTVVGFFWGTDRALIGTTAPITVTIGMPFSVAIPGFINNQIYYFQAYGTNIAGQGVGAILSTRLVMSNRAYALSRISEV